VIALGFPAKLCFLVAVLCFGVAVVVDIPRRSGLPPPDNRAVGNFFCSLGFLFLALGLFAGDLR
jgi:hypothetical protein